MADEVIHDTGKDYKPSIPVGTDPDTKKIIRREKNARIRRKKSGKKEAQFPPDDHIYVLAPIGSAQGQAAENSDVKVSGYVLRVDKDHSPQPGEKGIGDFSGNMILFCVDGCPDATFYQFYKLKATYDWTQGFSHGDEDWDTGDWRYDTIRGGKGPYIPLPDNPASGASPQPGMFDAPGQWGTPGETMAHHRGDKMTWTYEFETFVCCNKKLIGFWSWSQTLVFTWGKTGGWSAPSATEASIAWNPDPAAGDACRRLKADKVCGAKK